MSSTLKERMDDFWFEVEEPGKPAFILSYQGDGEVEAQDETRKAKKTSPKNK